MFPSAPIRLSRVATGLSALALLFAGTAARAQVIEDVQVPFNLGSITLNGPYGVGVAPDGTVYVADVKTTTTGLGKKETTTYTGRVIRFESTGTVTGNAGGTGSLGENSVTALTLESSVGTTETLTKPNAVVVDSAGNLYIADISANALYKATAPEATGSVTAIKFTAYPGSGPTALATDSADNLYVADSNGTIYKYPAGAAAGATPSTLVSGYVPVGLAVDSSGDLFFASSDKVYEYSAAGATSEYPPSETETYHFSNTVEATPGMPIGMGVDPAGNLYVLDSYEDTLWQISASATYQLPFSAATTKPGSMAVSSVGNLYISDNSDTLGVDEIFYNNNPVNFGTVLAGTTSPKVNANFNIIDDTETLTAYQEVTGDATNEFTLGTCPTKKGYADVGICNVSLTADFQGSTPGLRNGVVGFSDQSDTIYAVHAVGVSGAASVALYPGTQTALSVGTPSATTCTAGTVYEPQGEAISGDENSFVIADEGGYNQSSASPTWPCPAVYVYTASGGVPSGAPTSLSRLGSEVYPDAVALDAAGNLYVADYGGYVFKYGVVYKNGDATWPNLPSILLKSPTLTHPMSLTVDIYNNLWVGDMGVEGVNATATAPGYIVEVPGDGGPVQTLKYTIGSAPVIFPSGLTTDSFGNLFIADAGDNGVTSNGKVDLVPITGQPSTLSITAGGKALNEPDALAFDAANDLYIVDSYNQRILTLPFTYAGSVPTAGTVTALGGGVNGVSSGLSSIVTPTALVVWPNQNTLTVSDIGYQTGAGTGAPVQVLTLQSQNATVSGLNSAAPSASLTTINVGSETFTFKAPTSGGANPGDFSLGGCAADTTTALDQGVTYACATTVDYLSKGTGSLSATFTLNASSATYGSALGNVITALATGTVTAPAITLTPTSGSYVGNPIGYATLTNTGGSTLYINSITATSGGSILTGGTCGASLGAGDSCTIEYVITTTSSFGGFIVSGSLTFTIDGSTTDHGANNVTATATYNYLSFFGFPLDERGGTISTTGAGDGTIAPSRDSVFTPLGVENDSTRGDNSNDNGSNRDDNSNHPNF